MFFIHLPRKDGIKEPQSKLNAAMKRKQDWNCNDLLPKAIENVEPKFERLEEKYYFMPTELQVHLKIKE